MYKLIGLVAILLVAVTFARDTPRLHINAARELCAGTKCLVVYEAEEHQNEPCYVSLWCNAMTPCVVTQTLLAGWSDPMVTEYVIPPGGFVGWEGVYPSMFRVYVGNGRLPWKIEAEGVRAWVALETVGEVRRVMKPASVTPSP